MSKKKLKILIVEDKEADLVLIQRAVQSINANVEVITAQDGEVALETLIKMTNDNIRHLPNVIMILDINMPKKDGHEVLTELRRNDHLKFIPVVIFSSTIREADVAKAYANGCNSYFEKPLNFDDYCSLTQRLIAYWSGVIKLPMD